MDKIWLKLLGVIFELKQNVTCSKILNKSSTKNIRSYYLSQSVKSLIGASYRLLLRLIRY